MRIMKLTVALCALALILPALLPAQDVSGLTGIVRDATGAAIPAVDVKLLNTQTGALRATKTDDQGVYQFPRVPPGDKYKLTFTKENFSVLEISDVALGVGITETHSVELTVGSVAQIVEVKAAGEATLNTTDASIGNVIDSHSIESLPSLFRESPAAFLGLQAGVATFTGDPNAGTNANRQGAVTGSRTDQGNITIDGLDSNDHAGNFAFSIVGNMPIESVQEFRAVTAIPGASAEHGSGGQTQLVTKSGTNNFHGAAYEFNRTSATAANDFFNNRSGVATPQLTRNQFGAALGGPIKKDRLFFFFNYDAFRQASGSPQLRTVPLDHLRNGQVAYITNAPGCTVRARLNDPATSACIAMVNAAGVTALDPQNLGGNSGVLSLLAQYPHANDFTGGDGVNTGTFRFNAPVSVVHNTYVSKVDFKINSKQSLFARWNILRENDTQSAQQFPGQPPAATFQDKSYTFVVGHTWTVNQNSVNTLTVGLNHQNNAFPATTIPSLPNSFNFNGAIANYLATPFASPSSQFRVVPVYTFRDDYTMVHRKHTLQFGVNFRPATQRLNLTNDFNNMSIGLGGNVGALNASLRPADIISGARNVNQIGSQGWDNAFTALLGRFASQSTAFNYNTSLQAQPPGTGRLHAFRTNEFSAYWQDSWRVRSDLTMSYGVSWSYFAVPYEVNGFETSAGVALDNFFAIRSAAGQKGLSGNATVPLLSYDLAGKANNAAGYYQPSLGNFGPHLGFAYNPSFKDGLLGRVFGDHKTVVRAGGQILYDDLSGGLVFALDQSSFLFGNTSSNLFGVADPVASLKNDPRFTSLSSPAITPVAPVNTRPSAPFTFKGAGVGAASDQTLFAVDPNLKTPFSYAFSFGLQRELPGDLILDVNYVGRLGRRLFAAGDGGQITDFVDPASGHTLIGDFNAVSSQLRANGDNLAALTTQPFFENQINAGLAARFGPGTTCQSLLNESCTRFFASGSNNLSVIRGSLARAVERMLANGAFLPNIGLASQSGSIAFGTTRTSSSYNALLVSLRKRFSHGLQMDFNYTYSHSLDNASGVVNGGGSGICDLRDLRACRGTSDFDLKHIVSANWVYDLPFGRQHSLLSGVPGWLDRIVGGWQTSGIWSWNPGFAFNTTAGFTSVTRLVGSPALFIGSQADVANNIRTTGTGASAAIQYFNDPVAAVAAFVPPLGGQQGSRNDLRGPHFWNVDLALLKDIKIFRSENHKLQFRAEAFNAFNRANFALPDANITNATFGRISSTIAAARQMQFSLRYSF